MSQNLEDLPILSEDIEHKRQEVNQIAVKQLPMLFADLEEASEDKDLLDQYETDFLGELYASMVLAAYMGYLPDRMGKDAIDGMKRLVELGKEDQNDT